MSVFRDQWAVSWGVNTFTSGGTIAPATVVTYIETAAPEYDMIARSGITQNKRRWPRKTMLNQIRPRGKSPSHHRSGLCLLKDNSVHWLVIGPTVACKAYYLIENNAPMRGSVSEKKACEGSCILGNAERAKEKRDCAMHAQVRAKSGENSRRVLKRNCCFDVTKCMNPRSTLVSNEGRHVRYLFERKTRSFGRSARVCDPCGVSRQLEAKEACGAFSEQCHSPRCGTARLPPT
ncbi:hypothetical protein GGD67_003048 [Bradyrhizobium sp. IAR9]|nr:hypothetical protein [Bradyrhizobium sp. IAR9]